MITAKVTFYQNDYRKCDKTLTFNDESVFKNWVKENTFELGMGSKRISANENIVEAKMIDNSKENPLGESARDYTMVWFREVIDNGVILCSDGFYTGSHKHYGERMKAIVAELNMPSQRSDYNFG